MNVVLPAPFGADQPDEPARLDGQIDAVDGAQAAER